jgi:ABC-type molybdenum transport system ATPase subunit/photorepair protein PhrA
MLDPVGAKQMKKLWKIRGNNGAGELKLLKTTATR